MKKTDAKSLINKHKDLIHSENLKVVSHVQRQDDDWFLNTLMLDNIEVPFKFKRPSPYKSLNGQRVNLTYYRDVESVAGFELEIMKVVRIKVS